MQNIYSVNLQSVMEFGSYENSKGKSNGSSKHVLEKQKEQPDPPATIQNIHDFRNQEPVAPMDASGELNMEVSVSADEVIRAGGFGATDNISSILPVASDSTDFEVHLREVRGSENSEDKIAQGQSGLPKNLLEVGKADGEDINNVREHVAPASKDAFKAVNLEDSVTSDEVTRAGGFGATDNIGSFLPVASDFTDFEASLRDARNYEDLNEEITRPGLGWTNEKK